MLQDSASPGTSHPDATAPAVLVVSPRELLQGALDGGEGGAFEVIATATARDAERHLASRQFQLVLLDLILADGDGRAFLRRIRDDVLHGEVPVVVSDPVASGEMADECRRLGVETVLPPGAPLEEIRRSVADRVGQDGASAGSLWQAELVPGLMNRAAFRERFEEVAAAPDREVPPLLARVALDDALGAVPSAPEGVVSGWVETVARQAAEAVAATGGLVARWERGDFAVLWTDLPLADGIARVESIRAGLQGAATRGGPGTTATFSGAVAPVEAGTRLDTAMDVVRTLLLEARGHGGGQVLHPGASARRAVRVLLADDDPLTAAIVVHRLSREGMELTHVEDGLAALDEALTRRYSLLILDVKMPGIDGFEVLARIREDGSLQDTPVLMLTGMGREPDVVRGFSLGADDYMVKPFSPAELMARVGRLLAARAGPRSRR